jgi:hypothetical protein
MSRFWFVLHPFAAKHSHWSGHYATVLVHRNAAAVPGCSSALAGKLCTNEVIGAAKWSAVNRVRMSVPTWPATAEFPSKGFELVGRVLS